MLPYVRFRDPNFKMGFQTNIFCSKVPSKCRKCRFRDPNFKKFPGGACLRTPLQLCRHYGLPLTKILATSLPISQWLWKVFKCVGVPCTRPCVTDFLSQYHALEKTRCKITTLIYRYKYQELLSCKNIWLIIYKKLQTASQLLKCCTR